MEQTGMKSAKTSTENDTVKEPAEDLTVEFSAFRFVDGIVEPRVISLAREIPYTLFVNDLEVLSIAALPTHLDELCIGFLVSEGVLKSPQEVEDCFVDHGNRIVRTYLDVPADRIERLEGKGMLTSGCAGGLVFSVQSPSMLQQRDCEPLKLSCADVIQRMKELDTYNGIYRVTRGVHAASVASTAQTLVIREDLGRHNAVDKIVGHCFLEGLATRDKLLLATGRITSEVLTKTARGGFPIVISRSSASAMAVTMARQFGIDVITYVRAGRFNYFSHGATVLYDDSSR
jgi:FdhD protein